MRLTYTHQSITSFTQKSYRIPKSSRFLLAGDEAAAEQTAGHLGRVDKREVQNSENSRHGSIRNCIRESDKYKHDCTGKHGMHNKTWILAHKSVDFKTELVRSFCRVPGPNRSSSDTVAAITADPFDQLWVGLSV